MNHMKILKRAHLEISENALENSGALAALLESIADIQIKLDFTLKWIFLIKFEQIVQKLMLK